eukprot:3053005-Prymnesium_polylepis.1
MCALLLLLGCASVAAVAEVRQEHPALATLTAARMDDYYGDFGSGANSTAPPSTPFAPSASGWCGTYDFGPAGDGSVLSSCFAYTVLQPLPSAIALVMAVVLCARWLCKPEEEAAPAPAPCRPAWATMLGCAVLLVATAAFALIFGLEDDTPKAWAAAPTLEAFAGCAICGA